MAAAAAAEEGGEDSSSIPQKVTKVSLKILFSHKLRMRWQNDNDGLLQKADVKVETEAEEETKVPEVIEVFQNLEFGSLCLKFTL